MAQYGFGTGQLFSMPVGGGAPLRLGALQDVTLDISGDLKMLYGQYQFPLDVARGKMKIEGKIGTANIDVAAFNSIFFGKTVVAGQKKQVTNEAGAVPGSSTYTITAANGATFFCDLGVYLVSTGLPLKQVASSPASGEYTVSAVGVYTFNSAQASAAVLLNYIYTDSSAGGTLNITNDNMGSVPSFQLLMSQVYKGKQLTVCLYSCVSDKLSLPLKQDDHVVSEAGYSAQANDAGNIGFITTTSAVGGGA
jgi:hypothetical protein